MRRVLHSLVLAGTVAGAAGCGDMSLAYGEINSIIVGMSPDLWGEVEDSLVTALQPSITTTVRQEEVFQITYHDPADSMWVNLRRFRQLLLVGTPNDPWIQAALAEASGSDDDAVRASGDVWARGQSVTVVVVPESGAADAVLARLPEIRDRYLDTYRTLARNRMFVTGRDTALADTLMRTAGFSLMVPIVYKWSRRDSTLILRNDNPDPAELIRQFTVTWQTPAPVEPPDANTLVAWRDALSSVVYDPQQVSDTELLSTQRLRINGRESRRIQAVWKNPPDAGWPAAGSFIVQAVSCPELDRLYLIDAWLYAPGKPKFEYLVQLETILDSFRCASG